MGNALSLHPRLEAYRSIDGCKYVFMDMASVDPGHWVSYGQLRIMSRGEAQVGARDQVMKSLGEFPLRNGGNKRQRLRLGAGEPDSFGYHVSIRLASPTRLELTPYRVEGIQRRMDDQTLTVELPVSPQCFFENLEAAFRVAASTAG